MNLSLLHYRSLYVLVVLGVLAYSVAEEDLVYAAIAAPVALAAWILAGPGSPPVPRWLVNLGLISATAYMVFSWAGDIGDTIGVLCRYVTWLQLIKLFEPRAPRDHAQVIVLSVMLVIGACLTSVTINLGAVLLVYLPALLAEVMLFQIHASRHLAAGAAGAAAEASGRRTVRELGLVGIAAAVALLAIAVFVFIGMPRGAGEGMLGRWKPAEQDQLTGFRDHVQLGAQGLLTESRRVVMEMTIDPPASDPAARGRTHLLRGAVLDRYDPANALWRRSDRVVRDDISYDLSRRIRRQQASLPTAEPSSPPTTERQPEAPAPGSDGPPAGVPAPPQRPPSALADGFITPRGEPLTTAGLDEAQGPFAVLHITVIDDRVERLFTKWAPVRVDLKLAEQRVGRLRRGSTDGELNVQTAEFRLRYSVVTSPNVVVAPADDPLEDLRNPFLRGPVRELADRILAEARVSLDEQERNTITRAASSFQAYLQKNFAYTTQMIAPVDGQDPIEMFLFDSERGQKGHCEYFASAMVALCRSVGIPARMVAGYAASEFDPDTGLYTIRDNHAHAWAEVEIRPGRWAEFDPSPQAEIARLHQPPGGWSAAYRRFMSALQVVWAERFIGYDANRQNNALQSLGSSPVSALASLNEWVQEQINGRQAVETSRRAAAAEAAETFAFVLLLATLTTLALLLGVAMFRRLRRAVRAALHAEQAQSVGARDPRTRALARHFGAMLQILRRAGRAKPASVPPLDHARTLAAEDPDLGRAAERLTAQFYRARFGHQPPTEAELDAARRLLSVITERARILPPRRPPVSS